MRLDLAAALALAAMLSACGSGLITTPTEAPASAIAQDCQLSTVLSQVDSMLEGADFEAHYLTINHQLTLSIWIVDPELNPAAGGEEIDTGSRKAFLLGASTAHQVTIDIPCIRSLFQAINPMIVDSVYNAWYIDIIPMRAIPTEVNPSDEALLSAIERSGMEIAFLRHTPPQLHEITASSTECTWAEARAKIVQEFGTVRRNAAAYPILGYLPASQATGNESEAYVALQWDVGSAEQANQDAVLAVLENLAPALKCLNPPLNRLEVYVVDPQGRLLVYGLIPGDLIRSDAPLDPQQFTLEFLNGQ